MGISAQAMRARDGADAYRAKADDARGQIRLPDETAVVGVFPCDWKVREIGAFQPFVTSGSRGWARYYAEYGAPFLRITNLSRDSIYLDLADLKFVNVPGYDAEGQRTQLKHGDLLISITADIGIVGYVDDSVPKPAYINQHIALVRFNSQEVDPKFQGYFLSSEVAQRFFRSTTDQGAKAGLSLDGVRKIKGVFPSSFEQRAISEALSDVDGLLGALDALISKKRAIKQAAMQQLLTGKTRLPGFSKAWEPTTLNDLGGTYGGLIGKTKADFGEGSGVYITFMNVMSNVVIDCGRFEHVKVSPSESQSRVMNGDLLFNGSSETAEEIALCAVLKADVPNLYLNSFCFGFRLRDDVEADGLFLAYYLRSREGRELMRSFAQGSTRYNLSKTALLKAQLRLPALDEQAAIATVLSDMDAEITALEARRDKTRAIKQGMMQQLLTGRVRLVKPTQNNEAA